MSYPPAPIPAYDTPTPTTKKKSNVGIWIGVGIMALGVAVFVGFTVAGLITVGTSIDTHTVAGRETIELEPGRWKVTVPTGSTLDDVAVTDDAGRMVPIEPTQTLSPDGSPKRPSDRSGTLDVTTGGDYTVDGGGVVVIVDKIDLVGSVTGAGLTILAWFVGGFVFFIGMIITAIALIVRFA